MNTGFQRKSRWRLAYGRTLFIPRAPYVCAMLMHAPLGEPMLRLRATKWLIFNNFLIFSLPPLPFHGRRCKDSRNTRQLNWLQAESIQELVNE